LNGLNEKYLKRTWLRLW